MAVWVCGGGVGVVLSGKAVYAHCNIILVLFPFPFEWTFHGSSSEIEFLNSFTRGGFFYLYVI